MYRDYPFLIVRDCKIEYIADPTTIIHANQDGGLSERNPSHLLFPVTLLCIPVGLGASFLEATLIGAHIQATKYFLMRNDQLCPS